MKLTKEEIVVNLKKLTTSKERYDYIDSIKLPVIYPSYPVIYNSDLRDVSKVEEYLEELKKTRVKIGEELSKQLEAVEYNKYLNEVYFEYEEEYLGWNKLTDYQQKLITDFIYDYIPLDTQYDYEIYQMIEIILNMINQFNNV